MGKIKRINLIFIVVFIIINIFINSNSYANSDTKYEEQPIIEYVEIIKTSSKSINPDKYDPSKTPLTKEDTESATKKVGIILAAIRNISAVASVIVLMIIGFKYMIGSVEEKANYKATMIPYIIGCVMAVAGTTIVSFIYNAVK
mgnify:CR=1 FL=1